MLRNASFEQIIILLPALFFAFTIHELCHGLAAYALGDSTAKRDGRLSLNPIRHIDPIGLVCILVVGFGWAKPVMVNPHNLRNPKIHMALIAAAGPASNFVLAFLSLMVLVPAIRFFYVPPTITDAIATFSSINIMLGVFNLLPVPPLDGSKIIAGLLPNSIYYRLPPAGMFGMIILMVLMFTGVTSRILISLTGEVGSALLSAVLWLFNIMGFPT